MGRYNAKRQDCGKKTYNVIGYFNLRSWSGDGVGGQSHDDGGDEGGGLHLGSLVDVGVVVGVVGDVGLKLVECKRVGLSF